MDKQKKHILTIAEAVDIIKANLPTPASQPCALERSLGRYLAEDLVAPEPSPRYTSSAMDGYAVRWRDVSQATAESPADLRIVGESQAGHHFPGIVGAGEAVRISTGAVVAAGCDTVIRMEDTAEQGDRVLIRSAKEKGQDVRHRGEEFEEGEVLLRRGTRITAARAALLAAVGIGEVTVFRPCRVAILVTGSELVSVGEAIADDQIRDSNMIMLRAAVGEAGGEVVRCVRVADDEEATRQAIDACAADIVLCSGGISVGRHDHVKKAAAAMDFRPLFWGIQQKPGKPLFFARRDETLLFGLPGNPVSAFMCFTHYVRPLISALSGLSFGWPMASAMAVEDIRNSGKRTNMIRVQLQWHANSGYSITHAAKQGSHMLTSLTYADGYIILEPGQQLNRGQRIDVYRYDFLREPV